MRTLFHFLRDQWFMRKVRLYNQRVARRDGGDAAKAIKL